MSKLNDILEYSTLGWRVLPIFGMTDGKCDCKKPECVGSAGKHPIINQWTIRATDNVEAINQWWDDWPNANVGIATGKASGVVVLDVDDMDGLKGYDIPRTPCVRTGSGGIHYYFKAPDDFDVVSDSRILPGLDSRGEGGQVVAPPSMHKSGNHYEWIVAPWECELSEMPAWWREALENHGKTTSRHIEHAKPGEKIREGKRDDYLYSRAIDLVYKVNLPYQPALAALETINLTELDPPLDAQTVQKKLDSAWKNKDAAVEQQELQDLGSIMVKNFLESDKRRKEQFFTFLEDLPMVKPSWIIKNLIEKDSLIEIFGDPAAGKSFVSLDLSACISSGKDYHGHEIKEKGTVLYIAGEGKNGITRRLKAWSIHNNIDFKDMRIAISRTAVSFCDDTFTAFLQDAIAKLPDEPVLIVVDTWARSIGGDENSTMDTTRAIQAIDKIRSPYGCSILIVHHSGKGDKSSGRGSSALKGALDTDFHVEKNGEIITLTNTKTKDGTTPDPLIFGLLDVDLGIFDDDGEPICSAVLQKIDNSGIIKDKKLGKNQALALSILDDGPMEASAFARELIRLIPDKSARSRLKEKLLYMKLIKIDENGEVVKV